MCQPLCWEIGKSPYKIPPHGGVLTSSQTPKSPNFIFVKLHWMSNSECFLINIHAFVVITIINQLCWEKKKKKKNAAISVAYKTKCLFLTHITCGLSFPVAIVHNTWHSPKPTQWGGITPLQGRGRGRIFGTHEYYPPAVLL